jgi:hypothetical protein
MLACRPASATTVNMVFVIAYLMHVRVFDHILELILEPPELKMNSIQLVVSLLGMIR